MKFQFLQILYIAMASSPVPIFILIPSVYPSYWKFDLPKGGGNVAAIQMELTCFSDPETTYNMRLSYSVKQK